MKVVKYLLQAKIVSGNKEEVISRNFRHLKNARNFINELKEKYDLECNKLEMKNEELYITECKNDKMSINIEIKKVRLKKKKEEKTEQKQ